MGSLLEKAKKSMESVQVPEVKPKLKAEKREKKKPAKLVVPEYIRILFDNLDKSINSVWGLRPNGSNKWDAKYTLWLSFKKWFEGVGING